jgi:predicted ester cyclase
MAASFFSVGRVTLGLGLCAWLVTACDRGPSASSAAGSAQTDSPRRDAVQAHLEIFDDLDFNVFTNQKWDEFSRSHAQDILVHYPDGHTTKGLDAHIAELKPMFVFAPDTRIKVHPVKFGSGEWTSVIGVMEGTFTKPMPAGDGKAIPPTGKAFKISMATIGRWQNGVMAEEYLFWDNQAYMKQLGLAQ